MKYEKTKFRRIEKEGKKFIKIEGIDYGYANQLGLIIIEESERYILVRIKGQKSRFGIGNFDYCSPSYNIFGKEGDFILNVLRPIKELEYDKKTAKQKKKEILEYFSELNNGNDGIPPKPKDLGILPTII